MGRGRSVLIGFVVTMLGLLGGCSEGPVRGFQSSIKTCDTPAACQQVARVVGIRTNVAVMQGARLHFLTGFVYPSSAKNPTWEFRLQSKFKDDALNATLEEDAGPVGNFRCEPINGVEWTAKTLTGRQVCYLSDGNHSEARYYLNGVLYKCYLLPPFPRFDEGIKGAVLLGAVDSLK